MNWLKDQPPRSRPKVLLSPEGWQRAGRALQEPAAAAWRPDQPDLAEEPGRTVCDGVVERGPAMDVPVATDLRHDLSQVETSLALGAPRHVSQVPQ